MMRVRFVGDIEEEMPSEWECRYRKASAGAGASGIEGVSGTGAAYTGGAFGAACADCTDA